MATYSYEQLRVMEIELSAAHLADVIELQVAHPNLEAEKKLKEKSEELLKRVLSGNEKLLLARLLVSYFRDTYIEKRTGSYADEKSLNLLYSALAKFTPKQLAEIAYNYLVLRVQDISQTDSTSAVRAKLDTKLFVPSTLSI